MAEVAIIGTGIVSSLGNEIETFSKSLQEGKIGYKPIPLHEQLNFRSKIASYPERSEINHEAYGITEQKLLSCDDLGLFTLVAAAQAIKQAKLEEAELHTPDCGVLIGCGMGGVNACIDIAIQLNDRRLFYDEDKVWKLKNPRPRMLGTHKIDAGMASTCAANTTILFKTQGLSEALSSACSTGLGNIGYAYRMIKHGYQKRVICGGSETSSWDMAAAFDAMMVLSPTGSHSLSSKRDGFVVGAGSGIVVLEELQSALKRGIKPLAIIRGYYSGSCGTGNMVAPSREGQIRCIHGTMADGHPDWKSNFAEGWKPDVVKLHSTATPTGDVVEVKSIVECFGREGYFMTAPKAMLGHLLGASGSVELIAAIDMLQKGYIIPNIDCEPLDPELNFVANLIPKQLMKVDINTAFLLSFGFGGTNAGMLIEKYH